ncbi:lysosomal alpha-mannosidase-like [Periplaneta americana]|uniref:lysosomal alpha-mannosidase-like n=1 Tax=Periplaneta americana TaxID=6978 RepID=UPI0037E734A0
MEVVWRHKSLIAVVLLCILTFCVVSVRRIPLIPSIPATTCGYEACHKVDPNKLNVHLVPHTHDDVGWLKTVDEYYYGLRNDIQKAEVRKIVNTVVDALLANSDRRFIYVETAYFWKWWLEQEPQRQQQVKHLVNQGRLVFTGGAWSMNDEATTHYDATIDQFTWALRKLNDTFGTCGRPNIGWQIDTFGHSREMASILARMGYDGLFFARTDYKDKIQRMKNRTMELIWRGSPNLGEAADLFTGVLYHHYNAPRDLCYDSSCGNEIIDDKESVCYNVPQTVDNLLNFAKEQQAHYTTNNIMLTMGDDFQYQDANFNFESLDKLIKYVNLANKSVHALYSTPSCYLKAVNEAGHCYTTKEDDFFPYSSNKGTWWTGYYTSRPTLKYFERLSNNFLQVAKQLVAMTQLGQEGSSGIDSLREAMGVLQHHDAISGTERQHVANDYAKTLSEAIEDAREAAEIALNQLMSKNGKSTVEMFNCLRLNVSFCDVTESENRFVVTVYNPLSHEVSHFVRLPIEGGTYKVQGPDGAPLITQMVPIPPEVIAAPERENSTATHDLVFKAENLPPLGFRSYYVTKISSCFEEVEESYDTYIGEGTKVLIDEKTGLVKAVIVTGKEISLTQNFWNYESSCGAYLFHPIEGFKISETANVTIYKGSIVDEIHQTFSNWASQVVRIYHGESHVEFEWLIGPIPWNKDVVSLYSTDLQNRGVFYTDSNGRELLQRELNHGADFIARNYYPVTSRILIRDETSKLELAVLNDRAEGGTSETNGTIELMLHRRSYSDDGLGLGEGLDEEAYGKPLLARGRHYVLVGSTENNTTFAARERELAQRTLLGPWLFFSPGGSSFRNWQQNYKMEFSGLKTSLPPNVKILTLEPWRNKALLLRLEHIMEKNEDAILSKPVDISYKNIFTEFTVLSSHETTLAANQWSEEVKKLKWQYNRCESQDHKKHEGKDRLHPMEIKTYVINVEKRFNLCRG